MLCLGQSEPHGVTVKRRRINKLQLGNSLFIRGALWVVFGMCSIKRMLIILLICEWMNKSRLIHCFHYFRIVIVFLYDAFF